MERCRNGNTNTVGSGVKAGSKKAGSTETRRVCRIALLDGEARAVCTHVPLHPLYMPRKGLGKRKSLNHSGKHFRNSDADANKPHAIHPASRENRTIESQKTLDTSSLQNAGLHPGPFQVGDCNNTQPTHVQLLRTGNRELELESGPVGRKAGKRSSRLAAQNTGSLVASHNEQDQSPTKHQATKLSFSKRP